MAEGFCACTSREPAILELAFDLIPWLVRDCSPAGSDSELTLPEMVRKPHRVEMCSIAVCEPSVKRHEDCYQRDAGIGIVARLDAGLLSIGLAAGRAPSLRRRRHGRRDTAQRSVDGKALRGARSGAARLICCPHWTPQR